MELAIILILVCLADLVASVWLLARHKSYLSRIARLERNVTALSGAVSDVAREQVPIAVKPAVLVDSDALEG